ncbi:MAG: ATP-binding protein [Opitutaceae bacterium]
MPESRSPTLPLQMLTYRNSFVLCLLLVVCSILTTLASAQTKELSLKHLSLRLERWDIDSGLPADRVHAIHEDSQSQLWVSAGDGKLARFKNNTFEAFDLKELVDHQVRHITGILSDSTGRLWMYDNAGRLIHYDGTHFENYSEKDTAPYGKIHLAISDPNNDGELLLFTSQNKQTSILRVGLSETTVVCTFTGKKSLPISAAEFDSNGDLWLVDNRSRLFKIQDGQPQQIVTQSDVTFSEFFTTEDGELGVCGHHASYFTQEGKLITHRVYPKALPPEAKLDKCIMDDDANLWLSIDREYFQIIPPDGEHYILTLLSDGFTYPIYQLNKSDSGTIWLSSYNGLYQIAYSPFVTWNTPSDASQHQFISASEDAKQRIWLAAIGALAYLDPNDTHIEIVTEPKFWKLFDAHSHDTDGTYVLYTDGRVTFHDTKEETLIDEDLFRHLSVPKSVTVGSIISKAGDHWITARNHFIKKQSISSDNPYEVISIPEKAQKGKLHNVYEGPDGKIYLDTLYNGTYEHDPITREWIELGKNIPDFPQSVSDIYFDPEGRLWGVFPDESQLYLREGNTEYLIDYTKIGLKSRSMTSLAADKEDGVWFVTKADGVAYTQRSGLVSYIKEESVPAPPTLTWFDQSSGLGTKAGSFRAKAIICSQNGNIWVANSAGVSTINPKKWHQKRHSAKKSPPHIEAYYIDGELKSTYGTISQDNRHSNTIYISAGEQELSIEYTANTQGFWGQPRYRYRLAGYDNKWIDNGSKTIATFQNLPHGEYNFEVTSMKADGQWSSIHDTVTLVIAPHWSQRASTRILFLLLLLTLLWSLYRIKIHRLRKRSLRQESFARQLIDSQEDERKRIAAELHDSLGQDLLLIKNSTELAIRKLDTDSPATERLADISEIATHAIKEARAITTNLRPVELDRLGLRIAVQSMIERIAEISEIKIHSELTPLEHKWLEHDEINIFRIIQEALNNAIKHSQASDVSILCEKESTSFTITIADNGVGFNPDINNTKKQGSGLGIDSLHERVHLLKGSLTITSKPRLGTTLKIEIPTP